MDGVLVVDKPAGWTSHDVVAKIRNITRIKKVGHTGTLDPFATGVLPLTLGRATRLTGYFLRSDKVYRGIIRFGFATTTFDVDGEPAGPDQRPALDAGTLGEIFQRYLGKVQQTIPPYSAKKIRGKPMYSYARKGAPMDPASKEVTIHFLRLIAVEGCEAEFELGCAAGTYARSLAHDVGRDYGCGAHLLRLRRLSSGEFSLDQAIPLADGTTFYTVEAFMERVIPMRNLLTELPSIVLSDADKNRAFHGVDLNLLTSAPDAAEYRLLGVDGEFVAIGQRLQTFVSPVAQPAQWVRVHPRVIFA